MKKTNIKTLLALIVIASSITTVCPQGSDTKPSFLWRLISSPFSFCTTRQSKKKVRPARPKTKSYKSVEKRIKNAQLNRGPVLGFHERPKRTTKRRRRTKKTNLINQIPTREIPNV